VVVELSYLGRDLSDLPTLEPVASVQDDPVLLLELPQLRVDVERPAEVRLKSTARLIIIDRRKYFGKRSLIFCKI